MVDLVPVSETDRRFRRAFEGVFVSPRNDDEPFQPQMRARALLHVSFDLQRDELEAVAAAGRVVGDHDGFYVALPDSRWFVPVGGLDEYVELHAFDPPTLISPTATWGMRVYHDEFALAGGPPEFIHTLLESYPLQYPDTTAEDFERAGLNPRRREDRDRYNQTLFATKPTIRGPDQVREFLRMVKYHDLPWPSLRRILEHVYGGDRTRELLLEAELWEKYAGAP